MKKSIIIVIIILAIISWLNTPLNELSEKITKPVSSVVLKEKVSQNIEFKIAKLQAKKKELIPKKKAGKVILKENEVLQITQNLLDNIKNNKAIDFAAEKELLNYLRNTNNEQIYQFIIEKLKSANIGNANDDRLIEYSLSLLAAIDSPRASEIFFTFVAQDNWQGSNAIYTVRKTISKLARNEDYNDLVQQTFTSASEDNPFISELAISIAQNAKTEQIDYLISYIDGASENKSAVVTQAMTMINTESLVPHITSYLSDSSTKNVQNTALNTLANMGQYEAASALITWSSKQPKDSVKQIESLFNIALKRSPSTKRAIEKEINFQEFNSEELKELIINMSNEGL